MTAEEVNAPISRPPFEEREPTQLVHSVRLTPEVTFLSSP